MKLRHNGCVLIALLIIFGSCKPRHLVEKSGQWDRIRYGEYLVDANAWNVQAVRSNWTETIFYDTLKGSMGWRWDFSGEKDEPHTFNVKTFPEIIFGKKPYEGYMSTTSRLPIRLPAAQFKLEYEYSASACGVYNTTTDLSFTDVANPASSNIRAKMMIWFDRQNFPFFEQEKLTHAIIAENEFQVFIDTNHTGPEGKWTFIALLPEKFPARGELNFNDFFDYLLSEGVLKPEWYLSSIEVGSEISSGKGEIIFKRFVVH